MGVVPRNILVLSSFPKKGGPIFYSGNLENQSKKPKTVKVIEKYKQKHVGYLLVVLKKLGNESRDILKLLLNC